MKSPREEAIDMLKNDFFELDYIFIYKKNNNKKIKVIHSCSDKFRRTVKKSFQETESNKEKIED